MKAIVLAAGQGTRMRSTLPKVAHQAAGRELVRWVLEAVAATQPEQTVVVLGHGAAHVEDLLPPGVITALQEDQLGTGHAVSLGLAALGPLDPDESVLVVYGDMPTMTGALLTNIVEALSTNAASMATSRPADPMGFGRVLRDGDGLVVAIVEEREATSTELAVDEVNCGIYCFRAGALRRALSKCEPHGPQGEVYLTDAVGVIVKEGGKVAALAAAPEDVVGVNSPDHLAAAEGILRRRINRSLMESGVYMQDPDRVYVDADVVVLPGARLYPGVHLHGHSLVESGAEIGPDTFVVDSLLGEGAHVWYSTVRHSRIGAGAEVGPYASLRPGTELAAGSKAGTFVEMKNTRVGEGAKVPHLAYIGDATVGARANVGAGAITCNYDGYEKYPTVIGEGAFIGSDTMLVAPVTIGDGAVTGAGSVITSDVEAGALAVERSQQRNIPGYASRRAARQHAKESESH